MNAEIKKTGRKFKFTGKFSKENKLKTLYYNYFKEGEIYEEATNLVSDIAYSILGELLEKLDNKLVRLLTKDIEDGSDIVLVVSQEDVELVECGVNCDCFDEKIPSNEKEHEEAKIDADGFVKIEIVNKNSELSVSIDGNIDKILLKMALERILKDL